MTHRLDNIKEFFQPKNILLDKNLKIFLKLLLEKIKLFTKETTLNQQLIVGPILLLNIPKKLLDIYLLRIIKYLKILNIIDLKYY